jgi:hypothetical protein
MRTCYLANTAGVRNLAQPVQDLDGSTLPPAVVVNRELILLYWEIGRDILRRQREEGWGARVIDRWPPTCTPHSPT